MASCRVTKPLSEFFDTLTSQFSRLRFVQDTSLHGARAKAVMPRVAHTCRSVACVRGRGMENLPVPRHQHSYGSNPLEDPPLLVLDRSP